MEKEYVFVFEVQKHLLTGVFLRRKEGVGLEVVAQATATRTKDVALSDLLEKAPKLVHRATQAVRKPLAIQNVTVTSNYELNYATQELLDFFMQVDKTFLDYFITICELDGTE